MCIKLYQILFIPMADAAGLVHAVSNRLPLNYRSCPQTYCCVYLQIGG